MNRIEFFGAVLVCTLGAVAQGFIVNGIESDDYPAVVIVRANMGYLCSATAVSHNTLITAGHCLTLGPKTVMEYQKVKSIAVKGSNAVDLAVVIFPDNTFADSLPVIDSMPRAGDALTLVGFGETDFINASGDFGKRRFGTNQLLGFANINDKRQIEHNDDSENYLHYRSPRSIEGLKPGELAMTGRGDSGGAILIGDKLAGVVSFGNERPELAGSFELLNELEPDDNSIYEYDTNLASRAAREFLTEAKKTIGAVFR